MDSKRPSSRCLCWRATDRDRRTAPRIPEAAGRRRRGLPSRWRRRARGPNFPDAAPVPSTRFITASACRQPGMHRTNNATCRRASSTWLAGRRQPSLRARCGARQAGADLALSAIPKPRRFVAKGALLGNRRNEFVAIGWLRRASVVCRVATVPVVAPPLLSRRT